MSFLKSTVQRDFNRAASTYDNHAQVQRHAANRLFALVQPYLNNDQFLLDVGCGTGYFHELLRKNRIYCRLLQTDIAHAMCRIADSYASPPAYGGTFTVTADMDNLPLADAAVDGVFSSLTLQWSDNLSHTLTQLHRSLKQAGLLAISLPGEGTLEELRQSFAQHSTIPRIHTEHFPSAEMLSHSLEQAGFILHTMQQERYTHHYSSLAHLLRSLRGIGAGYKAPRTYPGKDFFRKVEESYRQHYATDGMLPARWEMLYVVAQR